MKKKLILILGLLLCSAVSATGAEPRRDALRSGFYVAPMLSYQFVDEGRGTDDGLGYGLAAGYRGAFSAGEIAAAQTSLDNPGGGSAKLTNVGINLLLAPLVMLPVARDIHLLIGYAWNQRKNHPGFAADDETYLVDTGLAYMPSFQLFDYDVALRVEYLYRLDTQQPVFPETSPRQFSDTVLRLGLQLPLSKRPPPPQQPAAGSVEVTPTDGDGDGVDDAVDRCPDTPAGADTDTAGCGID